MQLIILSGLSGAGKSVALHMLEDLGYYCIDNMPAALLKSFIAHSVRSSAKIYARTAISLDARNSEAEIGSVPTLVDELRRSGIDCEVLFLIAGVVSDEMALLAKGIDEVRAKLNDGHEDEGSNQELENAADQTSSVGRVVRLIGIWTSCSPTLDRTRCS